MRDYIVYGFAGVGVLVVACIIFFGVAGVFAYWLDHRKTKAEKDTRAEVREAMQSHLMSDSWWFSECVITMKLIQDLANGMRVDDAREKWRERRKESAGAAP